MTEYISRQKAFEIVRTVSGRAFLRRGCEAYSNDMRWVVWHCGQGIYARRPCSPYW